MIIILHIQMGQLTRAVFYLESVGAEVIILPGGTTLKILGPSEEVKDMVKLLAEVNRTTPEEVSE